MTAKLGPPPSLLNGISYVHLPILVLEAGKNSVSRRGGKVLCEYGYNLEHFVSISMDALT